MGHCTSVPRQDQLPSTWLPRVFGELDGVLLINSPNRRLLLSSVCLSVFVYHCLPPSIYPSFVSFRPTLLPVPGFPACICTAGTQAILSKPIYSSYLWERGASCGGRSAQTSFLCSLSLLPMWLLLEAMSLQGVTLCKQQRAGFGEPFTVLCGLWKHAEKIPRHKAKSMTCNIKGS